VRYSVCGPKREQCGTVYVDRRMRYSVCGPNREQLLLERIKLPNEELHNLYSLLYITNVLYKMDRKCSTHQGDKNTRKYLSEDLKGRDFVVHKGLYIMIILTEIKQ